MQLKQPKQSLEKKNDPYYKHKKSQFEMLMKWKYTTMMLGDSITDEVYGMNF